MRPLVDAVTFLTRIPVPVDHGRAPDLARAAWAFPLVGAATGLLLGAVGVLTTGLTGWLVAAVVVVLVEVLITGALHLDGLADCADGTGGHDRRSRLRIMKDHAVGVYGTSAVVLDLLLKAALVGVLLEPLGAGVGAGAEAGVTAAGTVGVLATTTIAWTVSRVAMLPLAAGLPYAREDGTGRALVEGLTLGRVVGAVGIAGVLVAGVVVAATAVAGPDWPGVPPWSWPGTGGGPTGVLLVHLVCVLGAVVLVASLTARWARRTLGGVTGDVLGATAEVTLLAALLASALA